MGEIISKSEFKLLREEFRKKSQKITLCHGVFDLVHPGHIIHFEEAKSLGDILVVSITSSEYVRKGPGRPYFDDALRLKFLSAIDIIDYIILSKNYTSEDIIECVKPDFYVKGEEYQKSEEDITGKIDEEVELVKRYGGKVHFTSGQIFSSSKLLNMNMKAISSEVKDFMLQLLKKYSFDDIKNYIEQMNSLKVLVIGDVIIDEYLFCAVQGLMSKDMGYSARYDYEEQYLGGALAIARCIASFSSNLTFLSIIGNEENIHSRILNELGQVMKIDLEYTKEHNTIHKKRFITKNEKREEFSKIFSINNLPKNMEIAGEAKDRFKKKIASKIEEYDVVVLCDFGHGLIDNDVMEIIQDKAKFLTVNCQTNSSNYGMNLITKYHRADAFSLDQKEIRLAFHKEYTDDESLEMLHKHFKGSTGWLTQGATGAMGIDKNSDIVQCPALTLKVKDTIGAGDAFFALSSLCAAINMPCDAGTFLGNIAGALAANIIGNKKAVDKVDVLKYVNTLMNI